MSDATPPGDPGPAEVADTAGRTNNPGLAQRFGDLPLWAQIMIPALVGGVLLAVGLLIANAASSKSGAGTAHDRAGPDGLSCRGR